MVNKESIQAIPNRRQVSRIVGLQLHNPDVSKPPHFRNRRMLAESRQAFAVDRLDRSNSLEYRLHFENLETRVGCGARKWIAGVGVSMKEGDRSIGFVK